MSPLDADPEYKRAHEALHRLWTKAIGQAGYLKEQWKELEEAIGLLARRPAVSEKRGP